MVRIEDKFCEDNSSSKNKNKILPRRIMSRASRPRQASKQASLSSNTDNRASSQAISAAWFLTFAHSQ
jgi:hypothetical protein